MKRVLLVEDEIIIAMALKLLLETEGYEVRLAANGRNGLAMAMEQAPDLIITDYMMPQMDGLAMTQALREAGVTAPVILFTSISESHFGGHTNAGYDAYLGKPARDADLLALMRSLLER